MSDGVPKRPRGAARAAALAALLAAVAAPGAAGCVERRLIVRTDPPGARVFLDGRLRGETPVEIPFTYYGTRELVLRAPERKTARVVVPLSPPWYQWTPLDFFVEVLWPFTVLDERVIEAKLEPRGKVEEEEMQALRERAEKRREEGR